MIAAIFLRIAVMIAVLINVYEDCDHDHSLHKYITFLSLYMIATIIADRNIHKKVLCLCLYEDSEHGHSPHKNVLFLSFCEDCDHDRSPHKMSYF